uniref:Uncharacterized protein n=1 Tax=Anguilla anguilla TaxID=7936 RepID=A0A0E9P8T5_ANGAN
MLQTKLQRSELISRRASEAVVWGLKRLTLSNRQVQF